jgi:large subunit ribosomal protein L7/L12
MSEVFERNALHRIAELERKVEHLYRELAGQVSPAPEPSLDLSPRVRELIAAGREIEAIKAYREETGVGLAEAKQAVDAALGG